MVSSEGTIKHGLRSKTLNAWWFDCTPQDPPRSYVVGDRKSERMKHPCLIVALLLQVAVTWYSVAPLLQPSRPVSSRLLHSVAGNIVWCVGYPPNSPHIRVTSLPR
jgi:hypothetical protein